MLKSGYSLAIGYIHITLMDHIGGGKDGDLNELHMAVVGVVNLLVMEHLYYFTLLFYYFPSIY